jgi:N-acetylmuramoyl-L-alanine amidase
MKIVVDAGHGGHDPGAINPRLNLLEKDIALRVALALEGWLMNAGETVILTRRSDLFVDLQDRARIANLEGADAFISIHCNAAENQDAHGVEIWTSKGQTAADSLATAIANVIQTNFQRLTQRHDFSDGDPDKEGNLAVLRLTKCPAVLIEAGFISNDQEALWLSDAENIQNIALSVSIGVSMWANG